MNRPTSMTGERIAAIVERLTQDRPVRRALPVYGRIHIDRRLPFIAVYRRPESRSDLGTDRFVIGAASYVLSSGTTASAGETKALLEAVARVMSDAFGAFLMVEVWAGEDVESEPVGEPCYGIYHYLDEALEPTVDELAEALRGQRVLRQRPRVTVERVTRIASSAMKPLFSRRELDSMKAHLIGLEVAPVYRDAAGEPYPLVVRQYSRRISTAIDRAAYRFTHTLTTERPRSFHTLGRRAFVRAVQEVDAKLADIGSSFDPLLLVTPVNTEQTWNDFHRSGFQRRPSFHYRPLPIDPAHTKHRLWAIRPERVEDPTIMYLFRDVQVHIDRQLDLLIDIERARFVYTSLQLHGGVEPGLLALAESLLNTLRPRSSSRRGPSLSAEEFAGLAGSEILCYRSQIPRFGTLPEVREDIYSGLMVSNGQVFVGSSARIPLRRADALVQHEIGTHVVTYHNGRQQPFQLLRVGLPGYDELQEGLAVLGEYLVGGLDADRMRTLAARVVAVHMMLDGAEFVDVWRMLRGRDFTQRAAFTIATRVYRGGGLAKDAMYLRGLSGILDYVAEGCDFDRLFLGKFGVRHVPVIDELLAREILSRPEVLPRYLERDDARARLAALRRGMTVTDLMEGRVRRR